MKCVLKRASPVEGKDRAALSQTPLLYNARPFKAGVFERKDVIRNRVRHLLAPFSAEQKVALIEDALGDAYTVKPLHTRTRRELVPIQDYLVGHGVRMRGAKPGQALTLLSVVACAADAAAAIVPGAGSTKRARLRKRPARPAEERLTGVRGLPCGRETRAAGPRSPRSARSETSAGAGYPQVHAARQAACDGRAVVLSLAVEAQRVAAKKRSLKRRSLKRLAFPTHPNILGGSPGAHKVRDALVSAQALTHPAFSWEAKAAAPPTPCAGPVAHERPW